MFWILLISKILKHRPPNHISSDVPQVIESPELKALELFIAEKNSEILCRFDGLLQQQQLLSTKKKTRILSSSSWLENDNDVTNPRDLDTDGGDQG